MFSGHSWLTSYTAKLRKRSESCHQSGRMRRDCSSPLLAGVMDQNPAEDRHLDHFRIRLRERNSRSSVIAPERGK